MTKSTLVIGDVHGHLDRLAALLEQENIIRDEGNGEWQRINHDVEVVQLGDLGHFGKGGSPTGDLLSYEYASEWLDIVLWGNHDRAVVDESIHAFKGFQRPRPEVRHIMQLLRFDGKLRLAWEAHGWFISHAGLALAFKYNNISDELKSDPRELADWLNDQDDLWLDGHKDGIHKVAHAIRDAISSRRGGRSKFGGILWRDINENLYQRFPQVFGHTADSKHEVQFCWEKGHTRKFDSIPEAAFDKTDGKLSYCIDIGGKGDNPGDECLAGIWLPEQRIVKVTF